LTIFIGILFLDKLVRDGSPKLLPPESPRTVTSGRDCMNSLMYLVS